MVLKQKSVSNITNEGLLDSNNVMMILTGKMAIVYGEYDVVYNRDSSTGIIAIFYKKHVCLNKVTYIKF